MKKNLILMGGLDDEPNPVSTNGNKNDDKSTSPNTPKDEQKQG